MTKDEALTIGEVAARTGLTERALRHYENEGLLKPSRTAAGRRFYVARDLEALAQVSAFKRAGFTVAQIRSLIRGIAELSFLVDAQLSALKAQANEIETAVLLLSSVRERLGKGEALGAATLCELIRTGEKTMEEKQWKKVLDRYYTPEEQAHWREKKVDLAKAAGFDQAAYTKAWEDLSARIEAALPLDPASDKAQGFVEEWNKLLEPFMKIASPEMMKGAANMWSRIEEWEGDVKSPVSSKAAAFIREAMKHAMV
ncbi:MAG: MerR family transcriptional regulator [Pseudomonadota bacterium]